MKRRPTCEYCGTPDFLVKTCGLEGHPEIGSGVLTIAAAVPPFATLSRGGWCHRNGRRRE